MGKQKVPIRAARLDPELNKKIERATKDGGFANVSAFINSYGRIAEECLGKACVNGGSEIAYAESPGRVVEAMNRRIVSRATRSRLAAIRSSAASTPLFTPGQLSLNRGSIWHLTISPGVPSRL